MRTASRFVLLLCTATMQCPQTPVPQPRFALEISMDGFPPQFVIVPEGGVDSTFPGDYLHPLRGQDIRDSEKTRPSAIKLVSKVDGDAVEITASVFFGPLDKTNPTLSLQGHPQQKIGTYRRTSTNRSSYRKWKNSVCNRGPSRLSTRNCQIPALCQP